VPPSQLGALEDWLGDGEYMTWYSETGKHETTGPHFGLVRTYINQQMKDSLTAGNETHPADAAAIKELFGDDGSTLPLGWSVMRKVDEDSAAGAGWFSYEAFRGSRFAYGTGQTLCTDCHGTDSVDYFKSTFPLQ
jgi:hypothetical protein